jgi:hypothetical protein
MRYLVRALLALTLAGAASADADPLTITDAWVRATPPGARTAAAYLTLTNGGADDRLLGGTTPTARELQLHSHIDEGGLTRMVRLTEIAVAADATVRLEPGGLHLMLLDITGPLRPGATIALALQFAGAGTVTLTLPVVDARATPPPAPRDHR